MVIRLKIENVERLPNGGPLVFDASGRSFEIGREGRDWNLPDQDMFISGRHCEVLYDNGGYWLRDVSRNGTFLNGSNQRIGAPHRLNDGDRLKIGRYIVGVRLGARSAVEGAAPSQQFDERAPGRDAFSFDSDDFLRSSGPVDLPVASQRPMAYQPAPPQQLATLGTGDVLRAVAAGAGISPDVFARRDEREVANEIGIVLRTVIDELAMLLKARAAAKVLAKSTQRTMIGSADNNPMKFLPSAEEIMEVMFARRRPGYMDAKRSFDDTFRDLKTHEIATYSAMQSALGRLLDDLSPESIEKKMPASAFSSKKTRAWDAFVTIWETKQAAHENGMLDVFLAYFSEAYAKASKPK